MKDYKPLGDYIREVNVRNKDLSVTNLLGVSISKEFIPSSEKTAKNAKRLTVPVSLYIAQKSNTTVPEQQSGLPEPQPAYAVCTG